MRVDVLTTFPEYLSPLSLSLVGRAQRSGLLELQVHDLRDWAGDRHRSTDDAPYGGGAGMVMRADVWGRALDDVVPADGSDARLLFPSPAGRLLTQAWAQELASEQRLVFACGRYEGIDARVMTDAARARRVDEFSLGDYVLNGGEVAVLAAVEAVVRLLPGVLGNPESLVEESYAQGLLEYPVFTRPPHWRSLSVPEVLLSGDHAAIARWRRDQSLRRTAARRPDLLAALPLGSCDARDLRLLEDLGWTPRVEGGFGRAGQPLAD